MDEPNEAAAHDDDSAASSPASSPAASPSPSADDAASSPTAQPHSQSSSQSVPTGGMTPSSTPLGNVNAARRPPPTMLARGGSSSLPLEMQEKLKAFHLTRQSAASSPGPQQTGLTPQSGARFAPGLGPGGVPKNFRMPQATGRAASFNTVSPSAGSPRASPRPSLAEKRGMALPGGLPGSKSVSQPAGGKNRPGLTLSQLNKGAKPGDDGEPNEPRNGGSILEQYSEFLDAKTGSLKFKGRAVLTNEGVVFEGGKTYSISLDEVDTLDELGRGNYGTVFKVRHSRPRIRRPGLGLAGNKPPLAHQSPSLPPVSSCSSESGKIDSPVSAGTTSGEIMALKEIRLELDDAKLRAIITELEILHRATSPFIVDFLGAFFQEGAVYICMEFMDGGSIDKLYGDGIPEAVLRKITMSATMGLKTLKDEHQIIHRDVKPTNILVNTRGQVKLCDFGVSGNLVASMAKTNIGCQSYMAPERISSGGVAQTAGAGDGTYSVQSDIWSLGLTITECAMGQYPYPAETYDNIFSQLSAIVDGDPPDLPADRFSEPARDFVRRCLMKIATMRPTYATLLSHSWLSPLLKPPTISEEDEDAEAQVAHSGPSAGFSDPTASTEDKEVAEWVLSALEKRRIGGMAKKAQPALHAAPLDVVASPAAVSHQPVPQPSG